MRSVRPAGRVGLVVVDEVDLAADDRLDAVLPGGLVELDGAVHDAVIGEPERGLAEGCGARGEIVDLACAVQQRVLGVDVEVGDGGAAQDRTEDRWGPGRKRARCGPAVPAICGRRQPSLRPAARAPGRGRTRPAAWSPRRGRRAPSRVPPRRAARPARAAAARRVGCASGRRPPRRRRPRRRAGSSARARDDRAMACRLVDAQDVAAARRSAPRTRQVSHPAHADGHRERVARGPPPAARRARARARPGGDRARPPPAGRPRARAGAAGARVRAA